MSLMGILLSIFLAFVGLMLLIAAINALFALLDILDDALITLKLWVQMKRRQLSEMSEKPEPKPKVDVSNDWERKWPSKNS